MALDTVGDPGGRPLVRRMAAPGACPGGDGAGRSGRTGPWGRPAGVGGEVDRVEVLGEVAHREAPGIRSWVVGSLEVGLVGTVVPPSVVESHVAPRPVSWLPTLAPPRLPEHPPSGFDEASLAGHSGEDHVGFAPTSRTPQRCQLSRRSVAGASRAPSGNIRLEKLIGWELVT